MPPASANERESVQRIPAIPVALIGSGNISPNVISQHGGTEIALLFSQELVNGKSTVDSEGQFPE